MCRRYPWKVLLFLTFQITIIVTWLWRHGQNTHSPHNGAEVAIVLFWNDVHDTPGRWFITPDRWIGPEGLRTCTLPKSASSKNGKFPGRQRQRQAHCFFTTDKSQLTRADAVVVSGQHDNNMERTDIPELRSPTQVYVFYSAEAPSHRWKTKEDYGDWLSAFNWTATYRRDSDVPLLYGATEKIQGASVTAALNQNVIETISHKNSSVAAIISHCHDRLFRARLIKQLQDAGLKVDIYGSCGTKHGVCPPWGQDCYSTLSKHYRFFLSFENSLCDDYVTEKLFKALQHPWVPIVFGGVDYSRIAPPKSVIEATLAGDEHGFSDLPKNGLIKHHGKKLKPWQVVELVRLLEQNQTLYLKYFDWKSSYRVIHPIDAGCTLCRKISMWKQSNKTARKVYEDIHDWWENGAKCP